MEKDYTEFIANMLAEQGPISPQETGEQPMTDAKIPVKAIFFDIYGTLLISSSGDVDQAEVSHKNLKRAFRDGGYSIKVHTDTVWESLTEKYMAILQQKLATARSNERPFPEIDIREVWQSLVLFAEKENYIGLLPGSDPDKAIIAYEILSNHVYPMPGMQDVLDFFKTTGLPMGIVSNAQFYTIHLMNYFLGNKTDQENIGGFDADLCVYSYKEGKGKPDSFLYHKLAGELMQKFSIKAEEALFIGNDMEKDVAAASRAGFKTVLFAGDKQSLRWRRDTVKNLKPDFIITHLKQLKNLI